MYNHIPYIPTCALRQSRLPSECNFSHGSLFTKMHTLKVTYLNAFSNWYILYLSTGKVFIYQHTCMDGNLDITMPLYRYLLVMYII